MKRRRSSVQRLAERLERDHGIKVDVSTFERTNAGHWQRSSGAWSWFMMTPQVKNYARSTVGSQFSVRELLKAKALQIGRDQILTIEVDPDNR